jgi:predicted amidohydrolase YtcJ
MMGSGLVFLALFLIAAAGASGQPGNLLTPDAIFYNGKIVTVDAGSNIQQAFAVKGGDFLAVGTTAKIRALAGKNTRLVDLRGSTVIPGLADDHHHVYASARVTWRGVDMIGVTTLAEMSNRLRQAVAKAKPGETVFTTVGWRIPDGRPNRQDLDQISMNVPIVAVRGRRGAMTLNGAALRAAGITREHATFEGIRVPTDSAGEPTGEGADYPQAMLLLDKLIPPPSQEEEVELIIRGQREQNSLGLTSMRELTLWPQAMRAYSEVWRQGKLSLRVSMQMDLPFEDKTVADLSKWGVGPGFGDHWLRLDSIGEEPYAPKTPVKQFTDIAIAVNRLGWRFAPHVNGGVAGNVRGTFTADEVLESTLAAYEAADRDRPIKDRRWIMEHIPFATPAQLDRLAKLGVVVSLQAAGYNGGYEAAVKAVGKERAERQTPIRDMLDRHMIVCAGSDFGGPLPDDPHPNNPFKFFYYYVTRKTTDGRLLGPEEKISRAEALRLFTVNSAYATFEEKVKGSIEAGKLADFVVLSQDIMTVPDDQILATRALATYVGGQKVFSAENTNF